MSYSTNSIISNSSSKEEEAQIFEQFVHNAAEENQRLYERSQQDEAFLRSLVPQITSSIERPIRQRKIVERDRESAHIRLYNDYFAENPVYDEILFRRRFRMHRHVFCLIMETLCAYDPYFSQKRDCIGRLGHSIHAKCTAAMRMIAYGVAYNAVDEYLKVAETTASECLMHFVEGVIHCFKDVYMRKPNAEDIARLLREGAERGFPGMLRSIDCMHWVWKNCPKGWQGQFQGRNKNPTLILEAVALRDLWIWHGFFGTPGSCNDINVLDRPDVFADVSYGRNLLEYEVNGNTYHMGYYLTVGIYPRWTAFIPSVHAPQTTKHKLFGKKQESATKDVERAFGVLQAGFAIIRRPALAWNKKALAKIMFACIIMQNMIVENERSTFKHFDITEFVEDCPPRRVSTSRVRSDDDDDKPFVYTSSTNCDPNEASDIGKYLQNRYRVHDNKVHKALKNDLISNIWAKFDGEN